MEQIEKFANLSDATYVVNECMRAINMLERRIKTLENMHHDKEGDK